MRNSYGFTLEEVIEFIANQREYQEDLLQRHANDDESSSQRKNEVRSRIVIPKYKAAEHFLQDYMHSEDRKEVVPQVASDSVISLASVDSFSVDLTASEEVHDDHVEAVDPNEWSKERLLDAINDPTKTPLRVRGALTNREKNRTCLIAVFKLADQALSLDEVIKALKLVYDLEIERPTLRTYLRELTNEGVLERVRPGVYRLSQVDEVL